MQSNADSGPPDPHGGRVAVMWMERGDRGCRRLSAWGDPCPCSVWTAGGRPCLALCPSSSDPHEDGKQLARRGVPAPLPTRSRTIDTAWSRRSSGRRSHAPHPVSQSRPVARIDRAAGPDTPGTARGRPPGPRRRHHRFLRLRWIRCSRHSPAGRPSPERSQDGCRVGTLAADVAGAPQPRRLHPTLESVHRLGPTRFQTSWPQRVGRIRRLSGHRVIIP